MDASTGLDAGLSADAGLDAGVVTDGGDIDAGSDGGQVDSGQPDAGTDGGDDSDLDGGLVDAGQPDSGSGESLQMKVSANPSNVLSGAALITWSGPLVSVYIAYEGGTWGPGKTPVAGLSHASSPLSLPVLGLHAGTAYQMQAIAQDADGGRVVSPVRPLTTEALPSQVPTFVSADADGGTPTPGYTMVARIPTSGLRFDDVTIVDTAGNTVWYYNAAPGLAGEFEQQTDGTFVVSIYDPSSAIPGLDDGPGVHRQIDVLGNLIHTWEAVDVPLATPPLAVVATNSHDLRLLPDGEALLLGMEKKIVDLSAYGGSPHALVVGDVLERVNTAGEPGFAWSSFDYLDPSEIDPACASRTSAVVDFTHANSIWVMDDGNYLLSSRDLSQAIKIDPVTGYMIWRLGGKKGEFTFVNDPLNGFTCQHGVRELPNGDIILFDDGDGHMPQQSRAVEYALDLDQMTATLVWTATADPPLYTYVLGYAQRLQNGNTLITYGVALQVQEVDPDGNLLWDLTTTSPTFGFYRALHIDSLYPPPP